MVNIKNNNLINYLQVILNKNIKDIELNDLDKIENITFIGEMKESEGYKIDISDLSLFKNVKKICIENALVTLENLTLILNSTIKKVILRGCQIDNDYSLSILTNVDDLELIDCYIEDYQFLNGLTNLESLTIFKNNSMKNINLDFITNNIKSLSLQECFIENFNSISKLSNLENLNILRSKINGDIVSSLNELPKLNELYISNLHNIEGLNTNIEVKFNLRDKLFDIEDSAKHM